MSLPINSTIHLRCLKYDFKVCETGSLTFMNISPMIFLFSSGHTTVFSLSVLRLSGVESPVFTDIEVEPLYKVII